MQVSSQRTSFLTQGGILSYVCNLLYTGCRQRADLEQHLQFQQALLTEATRLEHTQDVPCPWMFSYFQLLEKLGLKTIQKNKCLVPGMGHCSELFQFQSNSKFQPDSKEEQRSFSGQVLLSFTNYFPRLQQCMHPIDSK